METMQSPVLTPDAIIEKVCALSGYSKDELLSEYKGRDVAFYRQLAMTIIHNKTKLGMEDVAKKLGRRNHTTVIHAKKCIRDFIDIGYRKDEIDFFLNYDY